MPPTLLMDVTELDLDQVVLTQAQVYEHIPHRHEFMLLSGVCLLDPEHKRIVTFCDIKPDDWWFRGHVPGRPLLPGVLMLEMAAQTAALLAKIVAGIQSFVGFGGVDDCKFREAVAAPARLYLLGEAVELRNRRVICDTQGVIDGRLIFEARITGMTMR